MFRRLYLRIRRGGGEPKADASNVSTSAIQERNRLIEEARSLSRSGKPQQAMGRLFPELLKSPADAELLYAHADVLFDWGRYHEAAHSYSRAEQLGISDPSIALRHGWACYWARNASQALALMQRASEGEDSGWAPHFGLGIIAMSQKDWGTADAHFRDALRRDPANPACLANLANVLLQLGDHEGCVEHARQALITEPESVAARTPLAIALAKLGQEQQALETFAEVLRIDKQAGTDSSGLQNYANALIESSRIEPAIALLERELPSCPAAGAYANYSIALLAAGRYADGWALYEYRWLKEPLLSARFELPVPVWNGQDIRDMHILVRSEQGIGDIVQFARYLPMVKALGATVHFQRRKGLDGLESAFPGIDHVIQGEVTSEGISYYVNLLSLPRVFGTTLDSVPATTPYLHPDPQQISKWRGRLASARGLKIGVVWAGDPKHVRDRLRSIRLVEFAPLFEIPGVTFFSLQKGDAAEQLRLLGPETVIDDLGKEFADYSDTAAAIANLDLVVSVDTSVAHVAAALGIPTWVLLAIPTDFRWLETRSDSPWYPSMRLFRQSTRGDWQAPVLRIKDALRSLVDETNIAPGSAGRGKPAHVTHGDHTIPTFRPHAGIDPKYFPVVEGREGIFQYDAGDDSVGISLGWYGEYLNEQIKALTRVVSTGSWILEIGPGVGAHSVPMGRMIGSSGHLLLCESDAASRRLLTQNLESNLISNYTLLRNGLADSPDEWPSGCEAVDRLYLQRLDWLKISTRVRALNVLAGASETLWARRPKVLASVRNLVEVRSAASMFSEHGYKCWSMMVPLYNPANFFRIEENKFGGAADIAILAVPEEVQMDVELPHCQPIID